jgi:hypothetical protein
MTVTQISRQVGLIKQIKVQTKKEAVPRIGTASFLFK